MTTRTRLLPALALSAAIAGLAGCTEKTSFDPAAFSASTDSIAAVIANSPAMQSMSGLGQKMTVSAEALGAPAWIANALAAVPVEPASFATWAAHRLDAWQVAPPALAVAAPGAIIPSLALGKTFTYNPTTGRYEMSTRTGAPANGVRFVLYAVNPLTREVALPLNEVGYVDLTEEAATSGLSLRLRAYASGNNTPLVDYTASASIQTSSGSVTGATVSAKGYISDGTHQLDIDLTQSFSSTSGISVTYKLGLPERDISLDFTAAFNLQRQANVTLTVQHAGNTTVVSASGTETAITGKITHNGSVAVNIAGTPSNPTFTDASGGPLPQDQAAALKKVFDFVDALLDHVDNLLGPAYLLLGLTVFLL
jgi:hypothetical protein